jgi:hypothetical protein
MKAESHAKDAKVFENETPFLPTENLPVSRIFQFRTPHSEFRNQISMYYVLTSFEKLDLLLT